MNNIHTLLWAESDNYKVVESPSNKQESTMTVNLAYRVNQSEWGNK